MFIQPSILSILTTTDYFKSFMVVAKFVHIDQIESDIGTWILEHDNLIG